MITEHQFREGELRASMEELLQHPTLIKAIALIEEEAKPRRTQGIMPNVHVDTLNSQQLNRLIGVTKTIDFLKRLATPNPPEGASPDESDEEPFMHGLPKAMREAIKKTKLSD